MEKVSQKLKSKNLKVTTQRIAIYKFLLETNTHPTAEIIYNNLKEFYPTMSIATVYKTLTIFKNANLIQELSLNDSSFHYDAKTEFHSHLVCTCCNSVFDYNYSYIPNIKKDIFDKTEFSIEYTQLYFYGICKNCKKY